MKSPTPIYQTTARTDARPSRTRLRLAKLGKERALHLMVLPTVIVLILISYMPMYGIIIAFMDYDVFKGYFGSPWASHHGFEHFYDFFTDPAFGQVMRNTIAIAVLKLVLITPLPLLLALILNEIRFNPFKRVVQTATYLPHFISWVIVGGLIYMWLDPELGFVNHMLLTLGIAADPINFMGESKYFYPIVLFSDAWKDTGYASILYLAAISGVNPELYESAEIDGAGRWRKMWHITVPQTKGTFVVLFILSCAAIMSGGGSTFSQFYILSNPTNNETSMIIDLYALRQGFEYARYSFATAIGLFKSVLSLVLLLSANYISKKWADRSLF